MNDDSRRKVVASLIFLAAGIWAWSSWEHWIGALALFAGVSGLLYVGYQYWRYWLSRQVAEEKKAESESTIKEVKPEEGEKRVARLIAEKKQLAYRRLRPFGLAIVVVLFGIGLLLFLPGFWKLFGLLPVVVGSVFAFVTATLIVPAFAEVGWWWVSVPEMHAAIVTYLGACRYIIMNCNEPTRRLRFERLKNHRDREPTDPQGQRVKYILLPPGKGYCFLGWTKVPWLFKLKEPWYLHPDDQRHPMREPIRYLPLQQMSWNLDSIDKTDKFGQKGIIPRFTTNDPIDVVTNLLVRLEVFDPYLAVFGQTFTGEAVVNQLLARLRRVIAEEKYLVEGDDISATDLNPIMQRNIHRALLEDLGIFGAQPPHIDNAGQIFAFYGQVEISANDIRVYKPNEDGDLGKISHSMRLIFSTCGYHLVDVEIADFNATPEMLAEFEKVARARTEGKAAVTKAELQVAVADRKAKEMIKLAEGDKEALTRRSAPLKTEEGRLRFTGEVAQDIASKVGNLVVVSGGSGGPGQVAAMQQTLVALGGLPVATTELPAGAPAKPEGVKPKESKLKERSERK